MRIRLAAFDQPPFVLGFMTALCEAFQEEVYPVNFDPDVVFVSHGSNRLDETPSVFLDGESGTRYSAARGFPITAALESSVYVGPRANHQRLRRAGLDCVDIPFAFLSCFERAPGARSELLSRRPVPFEKPTASPPSVGYLAYNPVTHRERFFSSLKAAGKVGGFSTKALGNCDGSDTWNDVVTDRFEQGYLDRAVELLGSCDFALTFENENVDGYVTEKIVNAFLADCVPIYFGSATAFELFDRRSALVVQNPDSGDELTNVCKQVERYERFVGPVLTPIGRDLFSMDRRSLHLRQLLQAITSAVSK